MNLNNCFSISVFYVDAKDCINLVKDGDKYNCVGVCKGAFPFSTNVHGNDIIVFENIREMYFRPHTLYGRFIDGEHGSQGVIFTEGCENESVGKNNFNVLNHIIDSVAEHGNFSGESSMPCNQANPIVRVCSFASVDLFGVDQNRLKKKVPIENAVQDNNESQVGIVNLKETIQQILDSCYCVDGNHSCTQEPQNDTPEFVSIDFDDLFNENDLFK